MIELPAVVWFTGLSGSGKSTLAQSVFTEVRGRGVRAELLDGDALRGVVPTGFSRPERDAHIKRVGHLASILERNGIFVVASFISPYAEAREFVRGLCRAFVEVHVATPLSVCERRDPKGLYAKARAGAIKNFTGLDDPYEPPKTPELTVDTSSGAPADSARRVLEYLDSHIFHGHPNNAR